jgi:hypothetical protein
MLTALYTTIYMYNYKTCFEHISITFFTYNYYIPEGGGGILFYLCPSVLPSVQDIFRRIFLSNC